MRGWLSGLSFVSSDRGREGVLDSDQLEQQQLLQLGDFFDKLSGRFTC